MEEMIAKWIRETIAEFERAKKNQNFFQMHQMKLLKEALEKMRDNLLK